MKKKICYILIMLLSFCLLSAQTNSEGFDGFSWNTTISEFLNKYPSSKETTGKNEEERNERTFQRSTDSVIRVYRFFDNKLYWGRTVYEDPNYETEEAVLEKLIETYGQFYDSNKWTENNKEYFSIWKDISPTLSIELTEIKYFNSYGRSTGKHLFITYENEQIGKNADEYYKNQKKKNIEL